MFLALGTQHAMHMRHIIICDFSGSTIFFHHYLINSMIFEKKITVHEMCVLIFSTAFAWKISHSKQNSFFFLFNPLEYYNLSRDI